MLTKSVENLDFNNVALGDNRIGTELTFDEINSVNGGILPALAAGIIIGVMVGVPIGVIIGKFS